MKCKALVVECLFTEMCLLSLGEGLIFHQTSVFTYTCGLASTWCDADISPYMALNSARNQNAGCWWLTRYFSALSPKSTLWSIKSLCCYSDGANESFWLWSVGGFCAEELFKSWQVLRKVASANCTHGGQRCQTTSWDQTEPTVKHEHRCFFPINKHFIPSRQQHCSSLKNLLDWLKPDHKKKTKYPGGFGFREKGENGASVVIAIPLTYNFPSHLHQGIGLKAAVSHDLKAKSQKASASHEMAHSFLAWLYNNEREIYFTI